MFGCRNNLHDLRLLYGSFQQGLALRKEENFVLVVHPDAAIRCQIIKVIQDVLPLNKHHC